MYCLIFTALINRYYHFLCSRLGNWDLSESEVAQSFPTLCNLMDSSVHGILQARILEWAAVPFSTLSVQFSCSVMSDSLRPHGLQHTRLPCPSSAPRACSNSCTSSRWCHPTISSSIVPFSFCLPSFPSSGSFPMSQFFASGGQNIGASTSASVLPMNIQDWFSLGWTGLYFVTDRRGKGGNSDRFPLVGL